MHLKLLIQYDGTHFAGSQLQPQAQGRTVQGELEKAVARIAGRPVRIALAGRTDSGVHALGQVASLDFPERAGLHTPQAVQRALNALLPPDLAVTGAEEVSPNFHARFSASRRAYRYLIWNCLWPAPLLARYSLHVQHELDLEAMARAASRLQGTHDLAAFAGQGMGVPEAADDVEGRGRAPTVRTIYSAKFIALDPSADRWLWDAPATAQQHPAYGTGRLLALDLVANAFLPHMVRAIVGTLLEVGSGKRSVDDISAIIESRDRRLAGPTAKPHGLCLLWVEY